MAAVCAIAGGMTLLPAAPAFASTPVCTSYRTGVQAPSGFFLVLPTTSAGSTNCYLAKGDNSSAVRILQDALKQCNGYPSLAVDGDFGPATKAAVLGVQQNHHLSSQDGVYGAQTRGAMSFLNDGLDIHCFPYS